VEHPAWAVGSPVGTGIDARSRPLTADETGRIEAHLRHVLANPRIRLVPHPPEADVFVGERLIGVVYPEDDGGERTFYFEIAITAEDLARVAPAGSRR
jgi:hypothetical protein